MDWFLTWYRWWCGALMLLVLGIVAPAKASLVETPRVVSAAQTLSQAYQLSGLKEMTQNLAARYLNEALSQKAADWVGQAISSVVAEHKSPSLREKLNDPVMRAEMKRRVAARIWEDMPRLAKQVVYDRLMQGALSESDPVARKMVGHMVEAMTQPLNQQIDHWADALYTSAMDQVEPYLKARIATGLGTGVVLDATDLRGTINRVVRLETVTNLISTPMAEALGESTFTQTQQRLSTFLDGDLPPEVAQIIRAGPERVDAWIAEGKTYLPSEQISRLKDKIFAIPILTIPNEVYGPILAGSAAQHFALAFAEFPIVNAYELNRGREVTQVMIWQLRNKTGITLNVGQLLDAGNWALGQAGGLSALGQFGRNVAEMKAQIDKIERKATGIVDKYNAEFRDHVAQLEDALKEFQELAAAPVRDGVHWADGQINKGRDFLKDQLPEVFNGIPPTWDDFKKTTGIPDKPLGDFGEKSPLDISGVSEKLRQWNEDLAEDMANVLVDGARALLPAPEIAAEEEIPAQNPDENGDYDPVLLHNGEFTHPVVDLSIPGRGLDFQFTRIYRSRANFLGRLGWNWTHNFEEALQTWVSPDGPGITWVDSQGRKFFFAARTDRLGEFVSPSGVFAELRTIQTGDVKLFVLKEPGGMETRFDHRGFLLSKCDRFGNCLRCTRDAGGVLTSIIDTVGRRIIFTYDAIGRIQLIKDNVGREWRYFYDAHGDLVRVAAPATDAHPDISTQYYYSSGLADNDLNHNMTAIRDPRGNLYLRNYYGHSGFARDQIVAQQYGGPRNLVKSRYVLLRPRWIVKNWPDAENIEVDRVDLRDRRGVVKRYWHNAVGNLLRQEIVDARGKRHPGMRYHYNQDGLRVAEISPGGLTVRRDYLKTDNRLMQGLVSREQRGNRETQWSYDLRWGDVTRAAYPDGTVAEWIYNARGAVECIRRFDVQHPEQHAQVTVESNSYGQRTEMRDALGVATVYHYDGANRVAVIQDAAGRKVTTRFSYDAIGNITGITLPNGGIRRFEVDAQNLIRKEITPLGYERRYDYDAHGNVTAMHVGKWQYQFDYDMLDHLVRRSETIDAARAAATKYSYDTDGRVLEMQLPEGNRLRYTYDARGKLMIVERGAGTRDASFVQYQYDVDGHVVGVVDGLGHLTVIERNPFGEVTAIVHPNKTREEWDRDAAGIITAHRTKDAAGDVMAESRMQGDPLGFLQRDLNWDSAHSTWQSHERRYDAVGQLVSEQVPSGAMMRHDYDALGNRTRTVYPESMAESWEYNELGLPVIFEDVAKSKTHFTYDLQGRLTSRTDPNVAVTRFEYDDRDQLIQETPPEGAAIRYTYDGMGRRTVVAWSERVTRYDWDGNGRLRQLTDSLGRATRYSYDALDRLLSETYPDGFTARMQYNANHQVTSYCQPNGNCLQHSYDEMGNLVQRRSDALTQRFEFDALGRMVTAQEGDAVTRFSYSSLSHVTESAQGLRQLQLGYDADGRRREMKFGNENRIAWQRDELGRIIQVEGPHGFRVTQSWGDHGPEKRIYANGHTDMMHYDQMGNVVKRISPSAGEVQYRYNLLGNLISQIPSPFGRGQGEGAVHYTYDAWQQLTQAGAEQWHYNLNGEREQVASLQFDKNGNMISDGRYHYIYDTLDRLMEVQDNTGKRIARYTYDALNRRVAKETGGHHTEYIYDGWEPVEIYEDGKLTQQFVRGDDLDEPFGMSAGDAAYYFHRDRLGSVVATSDSTGKIAEKLAYDAFGTPSPLGGEGWGEGKVQLSRRYTGQIFDSETGLYYMRHRYYSPALGQFLTRDPLGYKNNFYVPSSPLQPVNFSFHQYLGAAPRSSLGNQLGGTLLDMQLYSGRSTSQNTNAVETDLYGYVGNNPLNRRDPLGLYYMRLNRDRNLMYLFSQEGNYIGGWSVRTQGQHSNRTQKNGDTPNGIYDVGWMDASPTYRHQGNADPQSIGWGFIQLTPRTIEAEGPFKMRGDLAIHGGGLDRSKKRVPDPYAGEQGWLPTRGCIRMQNEDVVDLVNSIRNLQKIGDKKGTLLVYDGSSNDPFNREIYSNPAYLPGSAGANVRILY